ncbi:MAG: LysR family transcriptional regulator [Christensenellaceae bacterium]|nr:LysR family transcriptional regulator [Christensenellaceae bacterium]
MDIKQLNYFIQIAVDESYSIASKKLYVSQPALSKVVKNLEQELNTKLFYSSERKTKLTDEGRIFFKKAQKIVEDFNELLETSCQSENMEKGHIALGLPPIVGSCYLSDLVIRFQNAYPHIDISITEEGANSIQQDVFLGVLDIGCIITPIFSNQFEITPIISDRNILLVNENHPLSEKETVTISDLRDENLLIFNEDFTLYHQIIAACRDNNFEPNIAVTSSQWDFLSELVSQNFGVSILPRPILEKYPHPHTVAIEFNDNESIKEWNVAMIRRKNRYLSTACKHFKNFLEKNLS